MRTKQGVLLGFLGAILWMPATAVAQGPTIEHSPVGCIVAEQYPKLSACFSPAANLARARVYFRAEGTQFWYYVDFKPEAPCFQAILPKPKRTIGKINYYVEAVDKAYVESRNAETAADVVRDRGACRKDVLAAPYAAKASVTVGSVAGAPAVPAGFAGLAGAGISGTALGIGALGLGAAGATVYGVTNNGGNNNSGNGNNQGPGGNPPGGPQPPTPPSDQPPPPPGSPSSNRPPNAVFEISPDPPIGTAPLNVRFDMCRSSDPDGDPLQFSFDFGDGRRDSGACRTQHTYSYDFLAAHRRLGAAGYTATVSVTDGIAGHERSRTYAVQLQCPPTRVRILEPQNGESINRCQVQIKADVFDPTHTAVVDFSVQPSFGSPVSLGADSSPPYGAQWNPPLFYNASATFTATVANACGQQATDSVSANVRCYGYLASSQLRRLSWVSDLNAPGARAQILLNGGAPTFPGFGRAFGLGEARRGENRIEGGLVEGKQTAGTWRFDFTNSPIFDPGSIRVSMGTVISVSTHTVVFQMSGRVGEPIAFTFRVRE